MFSTDFKPLVAASVFGSSRGDQIPAILYLGFNNTVGVELSTTRVAVPNTDTTWVPTISGVTNQTPIVASAEAAWIIGSVSLWTLPEGGTLVCTIPLAAPLTVEAEDDLSFNAGDLTIEVA